MLAYSSGKRYTETATEHNEKRDESGEMGKVVLIQTITKTLLELLYKSPH